MTALWKYVLHFYMNDILMKQQKLSVIVSYDNMLEYYVCYKEWSIYSTQTDNIL